MLFILELKYVYIFDPYTPFYIDKPKKVSIYSQRQVFENILYSFFFKIEENGNKLKIQQ